MVSSSHASTRALFFCLCVHWRTHGANYLSQVEGPEGGRKEGSGERTWFGERSQHQRGVRLLCRCGVFGMSTFFPLWTCNLKRTSTSPQSPSLSFSVLQLQSDSLLISSIYCLWVFVDLIQLHERGKKKTFLGFKSFTFVFPLCGQDSFKNVDNRKTPALNLATRALSFMSFNLSLPFWSCSILGHRNPDGLTAPNACVHVGIISRFLWNPRSHKTERVSPQTDWAESHFLTQCHHCLWRCQL